MEQKLLFSIFGLLFGVIITVIVTFIITKSKEKKSDNIIEKAKEEAEKYKNKYILELKDEQFKLKKQFEEELKDKKAEANGELVFSYGSSKVEIKEVQSVLWAEDGIHYCLMQIDGKLSADELAEMAKEIIEK